MHVPYTKIITLLHYYQDLLGTFKAMELWSATTASPVAYDSNDLPIVKAQMEDPHSLQHPTDL